MAGRKHQMLNFSSDEDFVSKKPFENWRSRPASENASARADGERGSGNLHGGGEETESQLYESPTLLYENDKFKILVEKQSFKRQLKFRLEDHLYLLKVETKAPAKDLPLLKDMLEILDKTLNKILEEMKNAYKSDETNVVYITIKQDKMVSAIRSQGVELKSPSQAITKHVLSAFHIFAQSADTLRLDRSFNIYFKILSHDNVMAGSRRRKRHLATRLGDSNETYYLDGCLQVKASVQNMFPNFCLLISCILLFAKHFNSKLYQSLQPLWVLSKKTITGATQILSNEIDQLKHYLNLHGTGPYERNLLLPISQYFNVQFHVIFNTQNQRGSYESYPATLDLSKQQLFLFQATPTHIIPIDSLKTFFIKSRKRLCLFCKGSFSYFYTHVCKKKEHQCEMCFAHFRPQAFLESNEYLPMFFCNSNLIQDATTECDKCSKIFLSNNCYENHIKLKVCLNRRALCGNCKETIYNQKDHVCFSTGKTYCRHCKISFEKSDDHFCNLFISKPSNYWAKLFFFDFIMNEAKEVLSCGIMYEKEPGKFNQVVFTQSYDFELENVFEFNYDKNNLRPAKQFRNCIFTKETKLMLQNLNLKKSNLVQDKFLKFFLNQASNNSVYLSSNQYCQNMSQVLQILNNANLTPKLIKNDSTFILMKLQFMNVTFLNISNYFNADNFNINQDFKFEENYLFFPLKLLNCAHEGKVPDLSYFLNWQDSTKVAGKKEEFWQSIQNKHWSFLNELNAYTLQQVKIPALACLNFLSESIQFQISVLKNSNRQPLIIFPFSSQHPTISSYSYAILTYLFLFKEDIAASTKEHIFRSDNISRAEFEYVCFIESQNPTKKYMHAMKSAGQKRFGPKYNVDLFCVDDLSIVQFEGCHVKRHFYPDCCEPSRRNLIGTTNWEEKIKFQNYMEKNHKGKFSSIKYVFECEWNQMKKHDKQVLDFLNNNKKYLSRQLLRLNCRVAQRGGMTESYRFFWQHNKNDTFYLSDINSAYAYICLENDFPVGKPKILFEKKDVDEIVVKNQKLYFNDTLLDCGLIFCEVLANPNLNFPFLQYRTKQQSVYLSLCRSCCEARRVTTCKHRSNNSRSMTSIWTLNEINFALSLGYTIITIFEVHFFDHKKPYLKEFIQTLNSFRMKYSCPPNYSESQKVLFCKDVNQRLDLPENLKIDPTHLETCDMKKNFIKLMQNGALGKFSSNVFTDVTQIVRSQDELLEIINQYEITDLEALNDESLLVKYNNPYLPPSNKFSIYIGAAITANCRIFLYEQMTQIQKAKGLIFSVDTDAIVYSLPKNVQNPLNFSNFTGDFKSLLPQNSTVISYYSLGNRNYCVTYHDHETKKNCMVLKTKGLCLKSRFVENLLTPELFQSYILNSFKSEFNSMKVEQSKRKTTKPFGLQETEMTHFTFSNDIFVKRVLCPDFTSKPFGYK